jgi:hypothetical protein
MSALAGDAHRLGDVSDWHALLAHSLHQQAATVESQSSVTVRHEDLRFGEAANSTAPEVFVSGQPVTNVPAEYN